MQATLHAQCVPKCVAFQDMPSDSRSGGINAGRKKNAYKNPTLFSPIVALTHLPFPRVLTRGCAVVTVLTSSCGL